MGFSTYFGVVAAILVFIMVSTFSGSESLVQKEIPVPFSATTTIGVGTSSSPSPITNTASVQKLPSRPRDEGDLEAAAVRLRSALVNILCTVPSKSSLRSISGSGVIIDPKGIILTNAHVAQYFLLSDRNVSCTIRTGSPAQDAFRAELVFISPTWIRANPSVLSEERPMGTGEHDFALLAVTEGVAHAPLPSSFPFVTLGRGAPSDDENIIIGSYAAQALDSGQIKSSLYPTIIFGTVKKIFTFAKTTPDLISLGGSVAAQEGSSGGGIVDSYGTLLGTLTTSTVTGDVALRNINAITSSYIRADYVRDAEKTIDLLLQEPTSTAIANFAPQIPVLEAVLTQNL